VTPGTLRCDCSHGAAAFMGLRLLMDSARYSLEGSVLSVARATFSDLQVQRYALSVDQHGSCVEELLPGAVVFLIAAQCCERKEKFHGLGRGALNIVSLFRWDAEKRRVLVKVSGPFERNPKWRYGLDMDLRNENWDLRNSFAGSAPLGSLNLRREAAEATIAEFVSGRWSWSTGLEFSHRDFRNVVPGVALTPSLLAKGYELKHLAQVDADIWHAPDRRITVSGTAFSQVGRIWSEPGYSFGKLQGSLRFHWFPLAEGDDYEMLQQTRAGRILGDVPFDELYMLGLERDNDLWMRGHIGTRNGRKGSAPLGCCYFLSNWEAYKNVYRNGVVTVKLGPFLDTGKITDPSPGLGSRQWLWDVGAQAKMQVFGVGVVFSYGKDLRSGNNAFYVTMP
jgi:hypothetical protein